MKSRITVALLACGLMAAGTGGVLAAAGGTPGPPSASQSQYLNGKACGQPGRGNPEKLAEKPCPPASPAGRATAGH